MRAAKARISASVHETVESSAETTEEEPFAWSQLVKWNESSDDDYGSDFTLEDRLPRLISDNR